MHSAAVLLLPDIRHPSSSSWRDRAAAAWAPPSAASIPVSLPCAALILEPSAERLADACARGGTAYLSIYDEPGVLRQGVLAAARREPFCSPTLAPYLISALSRACAEADKEPDRGPEALSAREREVAQLAAAGMSNEEIAAEIFVSLSTVKAHLTEVYRKLSIRRRSQIGLRFAPKVDTCIPSGQSWMEAPPSA